MKRLIAWEELVSLLEEHRLFIFRSPDLDIRGARDGEEMLALHREHQAHLLILDMMMPGPSPEEICRSVRADPRLRKVSIIAIGGKDSLPALRKCLANRSFVRPLDQEDFLGAVRALINVSARKDFRVLVGVQLKGLVHNTPFFGKSENISATGILFSTNRILDLGDQPELSFMLPGLGQIHTVTEIVRVEPVSGGDPKYGARFIDPSHQTYTLLESFINKSIR